MPYTKKEEKTLLHCEGAEIANQTGDNWWLERQRTLHKCVACQGYYYALPPLYSDKT